MEPAYILSTFVNAGFGLIGGYCLYRLKRHDQKQEQRESWRLEDAKRRDAEDRAVRDGVCALLRDRLLQSCLHFETAGYIPPRELECLSRMYSAYHDLGGNDVITSLYAEIVELPHTQEAVRA